jgi:hypothetical protein
MLVVLVPTCMGWVRGQNERTNQGEVRQAATPPPDPAGESAPRVVGRTQRKACQAGPRPSQSPSQSRPPAARAVRPRRRPSRSARSLSCCSVTWACEYRIRVSGRGRGRQADEPSRGGQWGRLHAAGQPFLRGRVDASVPWTGLLEDEEREALGRGNRDGWSRLRLPAAEDPELERWPSVSSSLTCHV